MEVCWEENCKIKDKPICCVDCEEKEECGEYCELCFDKAELEKYKRCPADCPDRQIEPVNCHMTCRGYLFRQKQNEEEKKKRTIDKEYDNFHKMTVWRMKEIMNNRKKGK